MSDHDAATLINRVTDYLILGDDTGLAQTLMLLMEEHPEDAKDVLAIFGRRVPVTV